MKTLYEADFYTWAKENAQILRSGQAEQADWEHIAEELESMSGSERRALESYVKVLFLHLLKWKFQPLLQSVSWKLSIRNSRKQIKKILRGSPGLKPKFKGILAEEYETAREDAADETGLALKTFPKTCPFTLEQVLDEEFLPEAATGKKE
jgi:hypothetical protein